MGARPHSSETVHLTIPSRLEELAQVHALLQELGERHGMDEDFLNNLLIAVIEAGTNAVQHGNMFAEDKEVTFAELKQRIEKTLAYIDSVPQDAIEGSETRAITTGSGEKTKHFTGQTYLFHYALPHFYFHATTAYDILRHNGVEVGKKDYIGTY